MRALLIIAVLLIGGVVLVGVWLNDRSKATAELSIQGHEALAQGDTARALEVFSETVEGFSWSGVVNEDAEALVAIYLKQKKHNALVQLLPRLWELDTALAISSTVRTAAVVCPDGALCGQVVEHIVAHDLLLEKRRYPPGMMEEFRQQLHDKIMFGEVEGFSHIQQVAEWDDEEQEWWYFYGPKSTTEEASRFANLLARANEGLEKDIIIDMHVSYKMPNTLKAPDKACHMGRIVLKGPNFAGAMVLSPGEAMPNGEVIMDASRAELYAHMIRVDPNVYNWLTVMNTPEDLRANSPQYRALLGWCMTASKKELLNLAKDIDMLKHMSGTCEYDDCWEFAFLYMEPMPDALVEVWALQFPQLGSFSLNLGRHSAEYRALGDNLYELRLARGLVGDD